MNTSKLDPALAAILHRYERGRPSSRRDVVARRRPRPDDAAAGTGRGPSVPLAHEEEAGPLGSHEEEDDEGGAGEDGADDDGEDALVDLIVAFDGGPTDLGEYDFEPLASLEHSSGGYLLSAGSMPAGRLRELTNDTKLIKAEAAQRDHPLLDDSIPEARVDVVWESDPVLRGRDVVVGIFDIGIDLRHGNLRDGDGKTRVLSLWEQNALADDYPQGRLPEGFPDDAERELGREFPRELIDAALGGDSDLVPLTAVRSDAEHGTHVAAIAAGNGRQAEPCGGERFPGVAKQADLLVVTEAATNNTALASINILYGVRWMLNHPSLDGRPVVINISLGFDLGPHDGTSLFEQLLDELVRQAPVPCSVVVAAGNAADMGLHAQGRRRKGGDDSGGGDDGDSGGGDDSEGEEDEEDDGPVPPGGTVSLEFEMHVGVGTGLTQTIELWYPGDDRLEATVRLPYRDDEYGPVRPGESDSWTIGAGVHGVELDVRSHLDDPFNGDNVIHVEIVPQRDDGVPPFGPWTLVLRNPDEQGRDVEFDAWLQYDRLAPRFRTHRNAHGTIELPGTAQEVITVGSYADPNVSSSKGPGELDFASSWGPTRDGRIKPDLAAPGVAITSATPSSARCWCFEWCNSYHTQMGGTSMAAPHVAGVIALMFERNPELGHREVRKHLTSGAGEPDGKYAEGLPNPAWGHGILDAAATLRNVPPPSDDEDGDDGDEPDDGSDNGGEDGNGGEGGDRSDDGDVDARVRDPAALGASLATLHRQAATSPDGARWAALVSRHLSEVRGLINTDRRIALCWHRMRGPEALLLLAGRPGSPQAATLRALAGDEGVRAWAERFLELLASRGSARLRADVRRYGATLLDPTSGALADFTTDRTGRAA